MRVTFRCSLAVMAALIVTAASPPAGQAASGAERLSELYTFVDAPLVFPDRPGRVRGEWVRGLPPGQMTPEQVGLLVDAAAAELGIPADVLLRVRPGLIRTAAGESDLRPALVQTTTDVNSAYPNRARGLFQLTPWLFRSARVPGHDNIFDPYDNTLAAMLIFWRTPSRTGHLLTTLGDQIDSCGRRMASPTRPACPLPGVWPQSPGWSAVRFTPDLNPYLSPEQRRLAKRLTPW